MAYIVENRPKMALLFLILGCFMQLCLGAVYKVGDSAGWTTIGNVDYKQWAANKTFLVGDVIGMSTNSFFSLFHVENI